MEVIYRSTRSNSEPVTASQAILKGLSDDGGLFVPDHIPTLDKSLMELAGMTYQQVAYEVMKLFLTDFTEEELKNCINSAYDSKFDTEVIAPLVKVGDTYHLELFHGATIAFKDMALSILPHLLTTAAKKNNVVVSVDLNFRKKLWTSEKAISVMKPLMKYVDVCIGNEEDAELCLGFKPDADVEGGNTDASGYHKIFEQMAKTFGFKYVVSTLRESLSATHNGWKALIYDGEEFYESKRYDINPIIDRVGGGDSFSGGLIYGLMTKATQGEALEFAVAASALKHTINGDYNLVSVKEVEALAGGSANGRVQR